MAAKVPRNPRKPAKVKPPAHNPKAEPGDNSLYGEEADRVQLISVVSKLSAADEEIAKEEKTVAAAKIPLAAAKAKKKTILKLAEAAGFTEEELTKRLEEMHTPIREMARRTDRELKHRRWLGIIDDEQSKLQLGEETPIEAKDEAHWMGEGYKAGLRQLERKPPQECPERFVQPWLVRYDVGLQEVLEANVPGGSRLRAQAQADFAKDNPEVDIDAAARKLKGSSFMEKAPAWEAGSADDPTYNFGDEDCASCGMGSGFQHQPDCPVRLAAEKAWTPKEPEKSTVVQSVDPEAPFEATEAEIAAQAGRDRIKAKREGTTPGASGDVI